MVTIGNYKTTSPFPGFLGANFPATTPQTTPLSEKMETRMRPPYAFEWGGGGGELRNHTFFSAYIHIYLMIRNK